MIENQLPDAVKNVLAEKLQEQSWFKTYANTTVTVLVLGVNVLWVLVFGVGLNVDPAVIGSVAGLIQLLGVLGIKMTPNGVTPRQIEDLESYGKHRKLD